MTKFKFSVVIPVYNVDKYLEECVNSVLSQSYDNIEVIIVDDGSTDSSPKLCDKISNRDNRVKVIHKKNGGLSSARNCGILEAQGDYLIFLDSDDYWKDLSLLETINRCISENKVDLLCFGYQEFDDTIKKFGKALFNEKLFFDNHSSKESIVYKALKTGVYVSSAWVKVLNRRLVIDHDLFFVENTTSEDIDWSARVLINANDILIMPKNAYVYRQRAGSIAHSLKTENLLMLANNIKRCVKLGEDIPDKTFRGIYWNYVSYQYCTFLINACKYNNNDVRKIIHEMKNLNWLLKYHLNKKVKMVYILNLLGFKTMCKVMGIYGKKRI